jgi:hypothetical protein
MANVEREYPGDSALPARVDAAPRPMPNEGWDAYDATVERLLGLLEENQAAIAALAQAWRHKSRALEVTQAELAHTLEALAAERRGHHAAAS